MLNEQELRRLASVIKDQLESAHPGSPTKLTFTVKFQNGSISEPTTIDEIFFQENSGSQAITRLTLREVVIADPACAIEITFSGDGSGDEKDRTIYYSITHDDKDWVFVTNSKIDERLSRIRKFSMKRVTSNNSFVPIFAMMIAMIVLSVALGYEIPDPEAQNQAVRALAHQYARDNSYPVIDFIMKLQQLNNLHSEMAINRHLSTYLYLVFPLLIGLIYGFTKVAEYLFPSHNFLWGDYVELYQRRKTVSYVIFVLILLGVMISLVANFISGRLLHWG